MRGIESNTCVDYSDPLTPTLSLWERETRQCLYRRDRELGTSNFKYVWLTFLALATIALSAHSAAQGIYQTPEDFLREVFAGDPPEPTKLWIDEKLKPDIRAILEHDLDVLRLRYWGKDGRTAWILEEIGKERPITTGIVIQRGTIERIKVLEFRESRGWEVRYPFFTDQFTGATLVRGDQLDRDIDGISGATLSVRALTKLARLALLLHAHSDFADGEQ